MIPETLFMAWEYVKPMHSMITGAVIREGFWKCTKCTNVSRASAERWAQMPLTDGGYVRKSHVVEMKRDRAIMVQDETFSDYTFTSSVLRHDVNGYGHGTSDQWISDEIRKAGA